ncbi:MAG: IPT/TIG domain-containing protein, partial [Terriglobales bacterium]
MLIGLLGLLAATSIAQVSVLTQHNDVGRTGQNLNETILNTSNVKVSGFGKLFWRTVDGYIYAQPLYVPDLSIQGASHNVVYVATQHNSVYAFDADDPAQTLPLWHVNLGTPVPSQDICIVSGDTNAGDCPFLDINPEIGITSTPVIDPSTSIMYVVAKTKNLGDGTWHFFLHALDLQTGVERLGGPVELTGQVSGGGTGSSGGILSFSPLFHLQRPGLLLLNGVVYIGFGSIGDIGAFHGWIMGYDATTLQQTTIFNVTPNGSDGGIWQGGIGLASDGVSNIFAMTGNGDFNANLSGGRDYGDSILKLGTSSGLTVLDYFTPSNQAALFDGDLDLGSGGPMTIPGTSLVVGMGKDKIFRVVDSNNMGHFNAGFDSVVQEFTASLSSYFGGPVYWDSPNNGPVVYLWSPKDFLKAYKFVGGQFQTTPITQSTVQNSTGFSNAAPMSLSANSLLGSGILWTSASFSGVATGPAVPGILRAFDATNLPTELWNSKQNSARDDVGTYAKWVPPTVANGKVYLGTFSGQLQVYGLAPPAASGIRFVQVASATSTTTTASASATYPSSQTAGDLNVVVISWKDGTSTVQSVTDSLGNPYSLAIGPTTGTALRQSIYFAKNVRAGSNSVTVTFNQAAASPDLRILEYSGVDTMNPLEVSNGAAGNSSVADSGAIATAGANDLILGANIVGAKNIVAGSPFTTRVLTATPANIVEDRMVNVPGGYNAWAPLLSAAPWVMQVVAFKAAGSTLSTAPVIGAITPSSGLPAGGTPVTITGTNFQSGATV